MATTLHAQSLSSSYRVLKLPELAHIVCSFLNKGTCANLLYVSRDVYTSVLPVVWEATRLEVVLLLIPGMEIYKALTPPPSIDLTRLNFHAPFVKTLYAMAIGPDFPSAWLAHPVPDFLLPNLQRLVLSSPDSYGVGWVPRFLGSSLLSFEVLKIDSAEDPKNEIMECPSLDLDAYIELFDKLSRNCPGIENLQVLPVRDAVEDKCSQAYRKLGSMTHLCSLTLIVSWVTQELMQALGQLPHLTKLSLQSSGVLISNHNRSFNIPNNSFTSLQELSLIGLGDSAMINICQLQPLFHNLTKADIVFNKQYHNDNQDARTRSIAAVKSMGQNSPHLYDISIRIGGDYSGLVACSPVLDAFKHMPLRHLRLNTIDFVPYIDDHSQYEDDYGYDGSGVPRNCSLKAVWTTFLTALPALEELHIDKRDITPEHLDWFASLLPAIRLLVFRSVRLCRTSKLSADNRISATQPITICSWWCFIYYAEEYADEYYPDELRCLNTANISSVARSAVSPAIDLSANPRADIFIVYGQTQHARPARRAVYLGPQPTLYKGSDPNFGSIFSLSAKLVKKTQFSNLGLEPRYLKKFW
ncbi:hypothetical protein FRC12_021694 [Ceratobasidium sp. 428]|nr:hypothetical protein FRC12_021694 [Ceratobasidium sp. 428]